MQQTENIQTNNVKHPDTRPLMVSIRCITYNHEPYIRQCLEGFVMQKTNFRFEAIVHDDASTDGTAAIIREYAEKYPDIIKPIFETENQYSKHDGSLRRIMDRACTGKYIALCEGDDYWTDPNKLQKQVDFLDAHPDYSMCWHNAAIVSAIDGSIKGHHRRYNQDTTCKVEDIIKGGGDFIPTASILYRKWIKDNAPKELFEQNVGDYPLQLFLALSGNVYYFDKMMSVYRTNVSNSWSQKMRGNYAANMKKLWFYEKKIYDDFNRYSYYKYNKAFKQQEYTYLFKSLWKIKDYITARHYWYKMDIKRRPWNFKWILYMHGYGYIKDFLRRK